MEAESARSCSALPGPKQTTARQWKDHDAQSIHEPGLHQVAHQRDASHGAQRHLALHAYPDARIISLTQQTNFLTSSFGRTTLVAAIEYTPAEPAA